MKLLLASALLLVAPMCAQAACSATDFAVKNVQAGADGMVVVLKGDLVNNCADPAAPQLEIVAKNAGGSKVVARKAWPAGTSNIAPGKSVPFNLGRLFHRPGIKTFAINVVQVRTW